MEFLFFAAPETMRKNCLFQGHSAPNAIHDDVLSDSAFARPILDNHTSSLKFKPNVRAPISMLFSKCSPLAILWAVIAIIIDAFKRCFVWTMTHVLTKISESKSTLGCSLPSFANLYPASSVVRVNIARRVITASEHISIGCIKRVMPFFCHGGLSVF